MYWYPSSCFSPKFYAYSYYSQSGSWTTKQSKGKTTNIWLASFVPRPLVGPITMPSTRQLLLGAHASLFPLICLSSCHSIRRSTYLTMNLLVWLTSHLCALELQKREQRHTDVAFLERGSSTTRNVNFTNCRFIAINWETILLKLIIDKYWSNQGWWILCYSASHILS